MTLSAKRYWFWILECWGYINRESSLLIGLMNMRVGLNTAKRRNMHVYWFSCFLFRDHLITFIWEFYYVVLLISLILFVSCRVLNLVVQRCILEVENARHPFQVIVSLVLSLLQAFCWLHFVFTNRLLLYPIMCAKSCETHLHSIDYCLKLLCLDKVVHGMTFAPAPPLYT